MQQFSTFLHDISDGGTLHYTFSTQCSSASMGDIQGYNTVNWIKQNYNVDVCLSNQ